MSLSSGSACPLSPRWTCDSMSREKEVYANLTDLSRVSGHFLEFQARPEIHSLNLSGVRPFFTPK